MGRNLGIDIGGSYIKIVDSDGRREKLENPGEVSSLFELLEELTRGYDSVGMAVAGFVDFDGFVHQSPNIPYLNGKRIRVSENSRLFVANDATLACLGEVFWGAGRKWKENGIVVCITLGTGLGGGVVINGKPLFGAKGIAMEVGHTPLSEDKRIVCKCGRIGCTEEFVSARAIVRYFKEITGEEKKPEEVVSLAHEGDKNAVEALKRFSYYTARAIQNISHVFNPHAFIISGGVIHHFPEVLSFIKNFASELVIKPIFDSMEILGAELGEFSGAYGALKMAEMSGESR